METQLTLDAVCDAIDALTSKIPVGTYCDDDNNCGGFLTPAECAELEALMVMQAQLLNG